MTARGFSYTPTPFHLRSRDDRRAAVRSSTPAAGPSPQFQPRHTRRQHSSPPAAAPVRPAAQAGHALRAPFSLARDPVTAIQSP